MTRILSELLHAEEPSFRLSLRQLEAANGSPNHDIRLTAELLQQSRAKLSELGLDPNDTTSEELYHVLQERVKADDQRLTRALRARAAQYVSAEADLMAGLVHALQHVPTPKDCFALKTSVVKSLLKKVPPKRAMKQLGYRSLESLLKHENSALVMAAAYLSESQSWQRSFTEQYKRLRASDFEFRPVVIIGSTASRFQKLALPAVSAKRQTVISLRELGTIILLPLPNERPAASVIATTALAVHELNEIQASSTFLRLAQVRPDFGDQLMTVVRSEPQLRTRLLDRPVPWHLLQRFYTQVNQATREQLFEPYLELEDFSWHKVEDVIATIAPSLEFWRGSASLSRLDEKGAVSLNLLDNALSCCNQLPYAERRLEAARQALMAELSLRYLKHETLAQAILGELQPRLAVEPALV